MKDIVIFGAGGHGREIHQLIEDINVRSAQWNFLGFLDGDHAKHGSKLHGFPVLGDESWLERNSACHVVVAVGGVPARWRVVSRLRSVGAKNFPTLIHPSASVGSINVELGEGTTICAGAVVTTDVIIGAYVIVNIGATVSHDCRLADFATLAPAACLCGNVRIGEGADIGATSTIVQGLSIGEWSSVGAGAVVLEDVPANATVVGSPARIIKQRDAGWQNFS